HELLRWVVRTHQRLLPGVAFPPGLSVSGEAEEALGGAQVVVLAVPSQTMRDNVRRIAAALRPGTLVVSAAKGLEVETGKRMSEVVAEELPDFDAQHIGALSGPNLSQEMVAGRPAASVIAAPDIEAAERMRQTVQAPTFRIYTQTDVVGVELGGALKNVIALGAGMADGLELGANAKAAFITRGLMEITRLGVAMGARPLTFSGLTGLGDVMATCFSPLSRNRFVGQELAKGRRLEEVLRFMDRVAEGVPTTAAARQIARRLDVEMPIGEQIYRILFEGVEPRQAAVELMQREPKYEVVGFDEV
ncbi:MAG: NAD(P)H-dependent glycerol-3-phosphate dehydrogenase, partial [Dehalococcoidia bacterium]